MKRLFAAAAATASLALTIGCKSSTGPSEILGGTWTLTITSLQSASAVTCPTPVTLTLTVTQVTKHAFNGTYTASPASCSGDAGTVDIAHATGTILDYGNAAKGSVTFSLDTQQGPSFGGSFTGTASGSSASGTVEFDSATPGIVINGNWSMAKS